MSKSISFWILALTLGTTGVRAQVITTAAGTDWIFPAQTLPALNTPLGYVSGVATDANGNLYLSDYNNNMIMKVSPGAVLTVVAGNGSAAFTGDGGPATSAGMALDGGVAVDSSGNVYFTDTFHNRIRKVNPAGIISTVAGNGTSGSSGDGGRAIDATLNRPLGVAVDSKGNLFIADWGNNRIRKVTADGAITTVAGTGDYHYAGDGGPAVNAGFDPAGLALDAQGNLYIADQGNGRIRKVLPSGIITTVAGNGKEEGSFEKGFPDGDGGPALNAQLWNPSGVAVDAGGNIYIAVPGVEVVRKVNAAGIITTIAGQPHFYAFAGDTGPATQSYLFGPKGVAVDSTGNVYIADYYNRRVRQIDKAGIIRTIAGNNAFRFAGDGGPAASAALSDPTYVALDAGGNLYFSDSANNRVRKLAADGTITTFAGSGETGGAGYTGPALGAALNTPNGVAVDPAGNVYIADTQGFVVHKVTPGGIISTVAGRPDLDSFSGDGSPATQAGIGKVTVIAVDTAGNLYLATPGQYRVRKVSPSGIITTVAGKGTDGYSGDGGPATSAAIGTPAGLLVDSSGNLYISDGEHLVVRKVSPAGIITTIAGSGSIGDASGDGGPATSASLGPSGLAIDNAGNLYVADYVQDRLRKVTPDGIITTVAGTGKTGFGGDGGLASSALLNSPVGVAVSPSGNIYFGDSGNRRIREILAGSVSGRVAPGSLSFSGAAGGAPTGSQTVEISASVPGVPYDATADASWLTLSSATGTLPASLQVRADPGGLGPGSYRGTVTISTPLSDPPVMTVVATLIVADPNPPRLTTQPESVALSVPELSPPAEQTLFIANSGGGSLTFDAAPLSDKGWLRVAPVNNRAVPGSPGTLSITADPTALPPAVYSGSVRVTGSTGETATIPVTLAVTASNRPKLLLSQTGLSFQAVANACAPNDSQCRDAFPQCFGVLNEGQGGLEFNVTSDSPWLLAAKAQCPFRAVSSFSPIPEVVVQVKIGALGPGNYEGHIQVTAPQADNSPQNVIVKLTVSPANTSLGPVVRPTGLIFSGTPAQVPGSLDVYVYNLSQQSFHYNSTSLTVDGGTWFSYLPSSGDIKPSQQAGTLRVVPNFSGMGAGTYRGGITLGTNYGLQLVDVLASVGGGTASVLSKGRDAGAACTPTQLTSMFTLVAPQFTANVGQPFPIELYITDDCGVPLTSGTVAASFSNGDTSMSLISLRDGRWAGTWTPANAAAGHQVEIQIRARSSDSGTTGEASRSGTLN